MSQLVRSATLVLVVGSVVLLQGQARRDVEAVSSLCGTLSHLDSRKTVARGSVLEPTLEHTSPLPNAVIKLYIRDKTPCCGRQTSLEQVTTGTKGEFTFPEAKPGAYWLVATVERREFKLALRLVRPDAAGTTCQLQEFEIADSGKIRILRMAGYL